MGQYGEVIIIGIVAIITSFFLNFLIPDFNKHTRYGMVVFGIIIIIIGISSNIVGHSPAEDIFNFNKFLID